MWEPKTWFQGQSPQARRFWWRIERIIQAKTRTSTRLDPVPEVQLIPIEYEGQTLLEMKVKVGVLPPYYYQDGTRTAFVRVGNESVECNAQQLLSLVVKGTHMTWDSLPTQVDASKHSFIILANTFREQTHQEWNDNLQCSVHTSQPSYCRYVYPWKSHATLTLLAKQDCPLWLQYD